MGKGYGYGRKSHCGGRRGYGYGNGCDVIVVEYVPTVTSCILTLSYSGTYTSGGYGGY